MAKKVSKPLKIGMDYVRGGNWNPKNFTMKTAFNEGKRRMEPSLKKLGFETFILDVGEYYRVSYGKKLV